MDSTLASVLKVFEEEDWIWEPGQIITVPLGRPATIDDLRLTKHKAEIVNGEMRVTGPSGGGPGIAMSNLVFSLCMHEERHGGGCVYTSRLTYLLDLPHRRTISPDVSWYTGPRAGAGCPVGAPVFAVEVRDWIDHGDEAERRMAAKRADYFAAGTQVVWDVDVLRENLIRAYRSDDPERATVHRRGEVANAEPAVPGWRFEVDELFR